MSLHQFVIDAKSMGMRLDLFLTGHFVDPSRPTDLSRSGIQRLIFQGQVTLNGEKVKPSARLKVGDVVEIQPLAPREISLEPQALPLEILYEEKDFLVINKAAGMVVHPAAGQPSGTLVNALLYHCRDLDGIGGRYRPGIVHRLDKDTSGVMIVAKNDVAFRQLARQFKERTVRKEYLALVWGKLEPQKGMIDRRIGRHRSDRKRMSSLYCLAKAREAVTEWAVEDYLPVADERQFSGWLSWVRLRPRTGRTHQIRVHLADLDHPLVGDKVYGHKGKNRGATGGKQQTAEFFPRQALHAERLGVDHPKTGKRVEFCAPLADDIRNLLHKLSANG
jgi:23S rRNA pseudouridine1911/1915/1917 synthase